jgi:hypothetical protein
MRENAEKNWNQFFGICIEKHLTLDAGVIIVKCHVTDAVPQYMSHSS